MATAYPVLLGSALAAVGALFMWFCVPVAGFFRHQRERRGMRNAESQSPALTFVVGAAFFAFGAYVAVGTLAGWVHPR